MADEAQKPDTDEDELLLTDEVKQPDPDAPKGDDDAGANDDDGGEEEVLSFGDDLTEGKEDDSALIKQMREAIKAANKRAADAESRAGGASKPTKIEVGEKPTLAGCDYDEDQYEAELQAFKDREAAAARQETEASESTRKELESWQAELKRYTDGKASLGYADVDDAEETVTAALSEVQQAVLVKVADNPAKVLYALAKHPDRLSQLATVTDPLKFAGQVARLEGQLKVVKKRKAPDPEDIERGGGSINAGRKDKELERLEKEAEKTRDRSKVVAYKRKLREAQS